MAEQRDILCWVIYDPDTGEIVIQCPTRNDARDLVTGTNGRIAVVRKTR